MGAIDKIKADIQRLSDVEWDALRDWMIERDHERWDAQIAADDAAGRLDELIAEAKRDMAHGKVREL